MSTAFALALGRRFIVALLCVAMTTAGCASNQPEAGLTPEQNALRAQKANWNKTVLTGALAGAALGAGIGLAAGGANRGAVAGVAALAGLLIGAAAGALVAERNLKFERRELDAEQRIAAAQESTQNLQARAATAEALAAKDRARLDELDQQYRTNQITAAKYRAEAASIKKDAELIKESSEDAKSARTKIVTSSQQVPALMAEEPKMGEAQRRLDQSADQIEEKLNRIPST
jgi:hypothetical protein